LFSITNQYVVAIGAKGISLLLFLRETPDVAELIETVRLIREHVVTRIAALSGAPLPPPLQ